MNTDCAFWIGSTHRVCQDYVRAGTGRAVLSDGCSSSPDTDVGARLLAKSVEGLLAASPEGCLQELYIQAVRDAGACVARLGLDPRCLDATLLTIQAMGDTFTVGCSGDGIVALGRRDGRLDLFEISYLRNCPGYASYWLSEERLHLWRELPDNVKSVRHWIVGPNGIEEQNIVPSQGDIELFTGCCAEYRFVAVLSDGVQSFAETLCTDTSRSTRSLAVPDVLMPLLAFKDGRGQFVQRRVQAFRKQCRAQGWNHGDDVAMGVLWLEDEAGGG